jgi:hypothetical protein
MRRRWIAVLALPLAAVLLLATSSLWTRTLALAQGTPQNNVYFGYLLGTPRIGAVAIDMSAPDANGGRILRAYVCDGLGPPEGMAVWFRGDVGANPFPDGADLTFTSAGGQETLRVTAMSGTGMYGAYTEANGVTSHFAAYPAFDGAGIYQVTLDESLHYKGMSTQGAMLDAQAAPDGATRGSITLADGKKIDFGVRSLALADPALLAQHGLSDAYKKFAADNQVPGEYVAVIAPGGTHWFGRSGNVREGQPGRTIIGLDKTEKK